jgi:hypothetical protein
MKANQFHSRRNFIGTIAKGAALTGLSLLPSYMKADYDEESLRFALGNLCEGGKDLDKEIKRVGGMSHPVAYDISQAIPWGIIWSNVYYMTNGETGTEAKDLGILNVLRHHGMFYALNDETVEKYKLGEFFHVTDPLTGKPALNNPYYDPKDGVFPLPGLGGVKQLQEMGTVFCVCDMARKVNAMFIAQKMGLDKDEVYKDLVAGTHDGILPAPSGVWALGRLAENGIAYIDASVG